MGACLRAEFFGGENDAGFEDFFPESVGEDAGSERVVFIDKPLCQGETVGGSVWWEFSEDFGHAGADFFAFVEEVATDLDVAFAFFAEFPHDGDGGVGGKLGDLIFELCEFRFLGDHAWAGLEVVVEEVVFLGFGSLLRGHSEGAFDAGWERGAVGGEKAEFPDGVVGVVLGEGDAELILVDGLLQEKRDAVGLSLLPADRPAAVGCGVAIDGLGGGEVGLIVGRVGGGHRDRVIGGDVDGGVDGGCLRESVGEDGVALFVEDGDDGTIGAVGYLAETVPEDDTGDGFAFSEVDLPPRVVISLGGVGDAVLLIVAVGIAIVATHGFSAEAGAALSRIFPQGEVVFSVEDLKLRHVKELAFSGD